jgi:di/tricarboxylate transporter
VTTPQMIILAVLAATVGLFLWGRFRHDVVALAALLACVAAGLVPSAEAFSGFGHPAVITVACVLVLSSALQSTGVVDGLTRVILRDTAGPTLTLISLTGLAAVLSGFMNNVGALALLMPVAIQVANRMQLPPGKILMPLAFGSILGGMTTLIGTPPNLIVSGFRQATSGSTFAMFDFAPVGVPVALVGLVFLCLIGWRLVPSRERMGTDGFETGAYFTEARVPEKSKSIGMSLRQLETELDGDAQVVGLIRGEAGSRRDRRPRL